jgi:hypothetical protein
MKTPSDEMSRTAVAVTALRRLVTWSPPVTSPSTANAGLLMEPAGHVTILARFGYQRKGTSIKILL